MKCITITVGAVLMALVAGCGSAPGADENAQYVESRETLVAADGSEVERVTPAAAPAAGTYSNGQADFSFWDTCRGSKSARWDGAPIVYGAASGGCKRRNGTWSGAQEWSGRCYTDLANIDGVLRCQ